MSPENDRSPRRATGGPDNNYGEPSIADGAVDLLVIAGVLTESQRHRLRDLLAVECQCESFGWCWPCREIASLRREVA